MVAKVLLTMLCEEVTVNYLYHAVQLLDCEPAHGDIQDELSEEFALYKGENKSVLISLQNR